MTREEWDKLTPDEQWVRYKHISNILILPEPLCYFQGEPVYPCGDHIKAEIPPDAAAGSVCPPKKYGEPWTKFMSGRTWIYKDGKWQ